MNPERLFLHSNSKIVVTDNIEIRNVSNFIGGTFKSYAQKLDHYAVSKVKILLNKSTYEDKELQNMFKIKINEKLIERDIIKIKKCTKIYCNLCSIQVSYKVQNGDLFVNSDDEKVKMFIINKFGNITKDNVDLKIYITYDNYISCKKFPFCNKVEFKNINEIPGTDYGNDNTYIVKIKSTIDDLEFDQKEAARNIINKIMKDLIIVYNCFLKIKNK